MDQGSLEDIKIKGNTEVADALHSLKITLYVISGLLVYIAVHGVKLTSYQGAK
jgi:hypothetical protein